MRVLWFEVSVPSAYVSGGAPIGGWQDSLERIVRTVPEIELFVAFMSDRYSEVKVIDGVTYLPIYAKWSRREHHFRRYYDVYVEKFIPEAKKIVAQYRPDLIQVFGTEWPLGQIAAHTDIPVVIHIMGAIVPYNNALYPPGFSYADTLRHNWCSPKTIYDLWKERRNNENWECWERKTWKQVINYMGRTKWDESLSRMMHPGRHYFHVEEALRPSFLSGKMQWEPVDDGKLRLISTGCSSFWKGPDMMLKVGRILTNKGIDFEWNVAGRMDPFVQNMTERHVGAKFSKCHINILGFKQPDELLQMLCSSTMYVHTAYIENSPNSICEAQCLGLPVVSTNVGGIASLVRQNVDGILIPSNDPWQMADAIIQLFKERERMKQYSESSRAFALARHNDEHIKQQLMDCYRELLNTY